MNEKALKAAEDAYCDAAGRADPGMPAAIRAYLETSRINEFIEFVKNAPVSSGVCCCGGNMDHSPWEGHSPVDQWHHSLSNWLEELS